MFPKKKVKLVEFILQEEFPKLCFDPKKKQQNFSKKLIIVSKYTKLRNFLVYFEGTSTEISVFRNEQGITPTLPPPMVHGWDLHMFYINLGSW
jgi:hypothetical protein